MHGDLWLPTQCVNSPTQQKGDRRKGEMRRGQRGGGGVREKERKKGPDAGPDTLLQQVLKRGQSEKPCLS